MGRGDEKTTAQIKTHNSDEQKTNQNKNIQTIRLVPDITNMNFFKSMSFKSGGKTRNIHQQQKKKQADGWLRLNPQHTAGIEKLG